VQPCSHTATLTLCPCLAWARLHSGAQENNLKCMGQLSPAHFLLSGLIQFTSQARPLLSPDPLCQDCPSPLPCTRRIELINLFPCPTRPSEPMSPWVSHRAPSRAPAEPPSEEDSGGEWSTQTAALLFPHLTPLPGFLSSQNAAPTSIL
jgi:hypothetical protein